jgi:hypothetical protein
MKWFGKKEKEIVAVPVELCDVGNALLAYYANADKPLSHAQLLTIEQWMEHLTHEQRVILEAARELMKRRLAGAQVLIVISGSQEPEPEVAKVSASTTAKAKSLMDLFNEQQSRQPPPFMYDTAHMQELKAKLAGMPMIHKHDDAIEGLKQWDTPE